MKEYLYNVTISADPRCGSDVLYYIQHKLFPTWAEREGWQSAKLLRIPSPQEDGLSVALQFEVSDLGVLGGYELHTDPLVARIQEVYGDRVTFYPTLMEIIKR